MPLRYRRFGRFAAKSAACYPLMPNASVERKFNQKGWFKCVKNQDVYTEIVFGKPICFELWIEWVRIGDVFLDSGMHQGNPRPYSTWRSNNSFWDDLIYERY